MPSFYETARSQPGRKIFLQQAERELNYADLSRQLAAVAALVHNRGLAPGDRVVIGSTEPDLLAVLFLGLVDSGITAVVVGPDIKPTEFELIARTVGIRGAIMDSDMLDRCCAGHEELALRHHIPIIS